MYRTDESWMRRAIAVGRLGLGTTSPNPAVGALLVRNNECVATAYHQKAGESHAEVLAIKQAGDFANDATLYVTLEPCNHFGKTPPCSDAIIQAGVKRVVIANRDPNTKVRGGGIELLRDKGIEVVLGVCSEDAKVLIKPFSISLNQARPMVTVKLALTTDERITTGRAGENWLSSNPSRALVQRLRSRSDCILVGKSTIIKDQPQLTNRYGKGSVPVRAFVDTNASVIEFGPLLNDAAPTVRLACVPGFYHDEIICNCTTDNLVDLRDGLAKLFSRGIRNILCEGGAALSRSLIDANLVDTLILIRTPILGSENGVLFGDCYKEKFKLVQERQCGPDTINIYEKK